MKAAVEKGLAARGLERVPAGPADLVLHYHASVTQRIDANGVDAEVRLLRRLPAVRIRGGHLHARRGGQPDESPGLARLGREHLDGIVDNQQWLERRVDEAVVRMLEKFPLRAALPARHMTRFETVSLCYAVGLFFFRRENAMRIRLTRRTLRS